VTKLERFHVYQISELGALPPVEWLIKNIIPEHGLVQIWGPPKSFKTYATLDMVLRIATNRQYFDEIPVKKARVLYIIGEGQSDMYSRIEGWRRSIGAEHSELVNSMRVVIDPVRLDDFADSNNSAENSDLFKFIERIKPYAPFDLFVIDTLNKNMQGDESSTLEMSKFVRGCEILKRVFNATVMVVHHSGHEGRRARGSSVLIGAVDTSIRIIRVPEDKGLPATGVTVFVEDSRGGPSSLAYPHTLGTVVLDMDKDVNTRVLIPYKPDAETEARDMKEQLINDLLVGSMTLAQLGKLHIKEPAYTRAMIQATLNKMRVEGLLTENTRKNELSDAGLDAAQILFQQTEG
jgi:hypothetical protein